MNVDDFSVFCDVFYILCRSSPECEYLISIGDVIKENVTTYLAWPTPSAIFLMYVLLTNRLRPDRDGYCGLG